MSTQQQPKQHLRRALSFDEQGQSAFLFERSLIWLFLLIITGAAAYIFLGTLGLADMGLRTPFGWTLAEGLRLKSDPTGLNRLGVGAGSLVVGLLFCGMLIRRIFGKPRIPQKHILSADAGGMVLIDSRGVSSVVEGAVKRTPGVVDARVQVVGSWAEPVRLKIIVWASAAAEIKELCEDARDRASEAVQNQIGLEVKDVLIKPEVVPLEQVGRMLE